MASFGVVFDLDGLLVDSERVQAMAFNVALAPYGIVLSDDDFAMFVGYSTLQNFRDLAVRHPKLAPDVVAIHDAKDRAYADLVQTQMRVMPGAVDLVRALRDAGVPMAVASSSWRVDVEACLRLVGLGDVLTTLSPGDEVPRSKPAPDVYLRAVGLLGLPASSCVALEDAEAGVRAAKAAGLACIAVPNRYTRGHVFAGADAVMDSLAGITPALLESMVRAAGQGAPGPSVS
jgi:HAD superfamily hydrolase (TIGR01509 family)